MKLETVKQSLLKADKGHIVHSVDGEKVIGFTADFETRLEATESRLRIVSHRGDAVIDLENYEERHLETFHAAKSCYGFLNEGRVETLFSRIRKTDLSSLLIEKTNGDIFYRSRLCNGLIIAPNEDEIPLIVEECEYFTPATHCSRCRKLFIETDEKYNFGRFAKTEKNQESGLNEQAGEEKLAIVPQEIPVKHGKRGRPKGSRNKLLDPNPYARQFEYEENGDDEANNEENDETGSGRR